MTVSFACTDNASGIQSCSEPVTFSEDGANQSDNVVGDVMEALIGALFLDGGFDLRNRTHAQQVSRLLKLRQVSLGFSISDG